MKMKKTLAVLLATVMLLAVMPFAVSADSATVYVGGVSMTDGDYLATGATSTVKTAPDAENGYAYYKNGVLTLCNYVYSGTGYYYQYEPDAEESYYSCLYSNGDIEIVIEGACSLENTDTNGDCITVYGNVIIDGDDESALELSGAYYAIYAYGIGADSSITVNGGTIYASTTIGLEADGHGSNAYLTINGGLTALDCTENGILVYADQKSLITVNGGETVAMADVTAYSISSAAEITVNRGALYALTENIAVSAYSDASTADELLATITVNGGDLYAMGAYCGIYADETFVNGGSFVMAYDSETNPDGMLYSGDIAINDMLPQQGTLTDAEFMAGHDRIGDVNADGVIDQIDYLFVKRYCFGTYDLWGSETLRADVNADEKVDAVDYVLIKRICFGTFTSPSDEAIA